VMLAQQYTKHRQEDADHLGREEVDRVQAD
jgi:hypothetical protein